MLSTMLGKKFATLLDIATFKRRGTDTLRTPDSTPTSSPTKARKELEETPSSSVDNYTSADIATSPSASELSHSTLISDNDEDDADKHVYEGKVALLPMCFSGHGGWKGKERADQPRRCQLKALRCGTMAACKKAGISPTGAAEEHHRLTTGYGHHDLRRWLTTPNSRICAPDDDRSTRFLTGEQFTLFDLHDRIMFAVHEVQYEHAHIESLVDYAKRVPYNLHFRDPVACKANMNYFSMEPEDFEGAPREGLEEDVLQAALELDYLRSMADWVGGKILEAKMKAARVGNRSEIAELLRLGVVSEEWVNEKCLVI